MPESLIQLPDGTFHRVSIKALIFDEDNRLLVIKNDQNMWEMPGGGWDAGESFADCLKRELEEEFAGEISEIGNIEFCYQGKTGKGYPKVSIAVNVGLKDYANEPKEADILEMKFVTRDEFTTLQLDPGDAEAKYHINDIWRI